MDCAQVNPQSIPLPSRRGWLGRCLAGTMLISLSWAQPALADWADDTMAIAKLASQGNFIAAEKVATQSLNKGPGGLLFAGTGTLIIYHWRARLRLLGGDTQGAIADAEKVIQANSSFFPPDAGYVVRSMAKALARDPSGSEADFGLAIQAAESGWMSRMRIYGAKGERAIARILLNDFAGALQDLNEAISGDHDTRMLAAYVQAKKASWTHLRQAIPHLEMGDLDQAAVPIRAAIDVLLHAGTQQTGSDFLSPQLLLMQIDLMAAERLATQLPSSPALGAAEVKSWGKIIYDPELSSQTMENFQKAYDAVDELFAKYKIILDNPVTIVVTANTESYIQAIMLYGDLSRADAEHKAISPYVNMGVSSSKKPAIVLRWIPTRQLTAPGISHLVNNPQEGFALPHEVFHQVQNQYSLVPRANWLLEGPPELFRFMALETAGFKRVTDSVQLAEQSVRQAKEIPDTRQLASYDYKTWSSLARQGYPIYPMAVIMMARLVGNNEFEKVLFFHRLLHDGGDPDKAFVTAFGVQMSNFLTDMNEYFNKLRTDVSPGSKV